MAKFWPVGCWQKWWTWLRKRVLGSWTLSFPSSFLLCGIHFRWLRLEQLSCSMRKSQVLKMMEYQNSKIPRPLGHGLPPLLLKLPCVSHLLGVLSHSAKPNPDWNASQKQFSNTSLTYACSLPWHPTSGDLSSGDNYTNLKWHIYWVFPWINIYDIKDYKWTCYYPINVKLIHTLLTHIYTHNQSINVYEVWEMFEECL